MKAIVDHVAGKAIRLGKGQTRHLYADRTQQLAQPQQCLATARCATTILAFTDDFAVGAQDCMLEANQIRIEPEWLDTRTAGDIAKVPLSGARRIGIEVAKGGKDNPAMQQAKNDGTLPIEDHNTRIVVFGDDPQAVHSVAHAIAKEAFHNVSIFAGKAVDLRMAVK